MSSFLALTCVRYLAERLFFFKKEPLNLLYKERYLGSSTTNKKKSILSGALCSPVIAATPVSPSRPFPYCDLIGIIILLGLHQIQNLRLVNLR